MAPMLTRWPSGPPSGGTRRWALFDPPLGRWRRETRATNIDGTQAAFEETHAMNSLLAALPWPRRRRVHAPARPVVIADAEGLGEEPFSRCGWFDSSLEQAGGLVVTEHVELGPDSLEVDGRLWPAGAR
jgi:hypothetical protein